jgi:hypothetical protein
MNFNLLFLFCKETPISTAHFHSFWMYLPPHAIIRAPHISPSQYLAKCFEGIFRLHVHGWRINQRTNHHDISHMCSFPYFNSHYNLNFLPQCVISVCLRGRSLLLAGLDKRMRSGWSGVRLWNSRIACEVFSRGDVIDLQHEAEFLSPHWPSQPTHSLIHSDAVANLRRFNFAPVQTAVCKNAAWVDSLQWSSLICIPRQKYCNAEIKELQMTGLCVGEKIIAQKILLGKSQGKILLVISKSRWKDDIKCISKQTKLTPWPESASELYQLSDSRLSAKLVPTFTNSVSHVTSRPWRWSCCWLLCWKILSSLESVVLRAVVLQSSNHRVVCW